MSKGLFSNAKCFSYVHGLREFDSGSISSDEGVVMGKTPSPCMENAEPFNSTSLDGSNFSPPPPVLSLNDDYISESGLLLPNVAGSSESGILVS